MIERWHTYQLSIPSVPVGGLQQVPLQLDTDAPFSLRMLKTRNLPIASGAFRYRNPREVYATQNYVSDSIDNGMGTVSGPNQGRIVYPEYIYPVGASIMVDIANFTGGALTNVRILFKGAKLFPDGSFAAPSYPVRLSMLPFVYPVVVPGVPISGAATQVPGLSCGLVSNNILNIDSDSDFALRYLAADPFALNVDGGASNPPQSYSEVYVQLYDESRKYYSNEPIHIDDLFGEGSPQEGETNNQPNSFLPGLLVPELYLLKEGALYFDVYRDDAALVNQFPVQIHFRFGGAKVFAR